MCEEVVDNLVSSREVEEGEIRRHLSCSMETFDTSHGSVGLGVMSNLSYLL